MSRSAIMPIIILLAVIFADRPGRADTPRDAGEPETGQGNTEESAATGDFLSAPFLELLREDIVLEIMPQTRRVELGVSFLMPGTEVFTLEGRGLRLDFDYRFDPGLGILELFGEHGGGCLRASLLRRPIPLPRLQRLHPLKTWRDLRREIEQGQVREERSRAEGKSSSGAGGGQLRMGGSKSLVLRMGSGESVALEQNLRLNLQGYLSDSTMVEAVLRDDDLPFQPEGNTERLDELDKVFIRIKGPAGQAQVGDFVFAAGERELTPFRRDFKGIAGEWRGGRGRVSTWLAKSKGIFKSIEFYGEDGLQGPYELLSALRGDVAVVLAGSERVRVNGRVLTRGRDRDYSIDYDQGTVTFSTGFVVSAGDVIRVDFRYSQEDWRRNAWGAGFGGRLGGLRLDYLHFSEQDDGEAPLSFSLNEELRGIFATAGDGEALASGVSHVPGEGRYVLDPAFPDLEVYAWVDSLGDYNVRFHEAGAGLGDYEFSGVSTLGERYFAYVGEGNGSFRRGQVLRAPTGYRLESLRLDWDRPGLRAKAEIALSERDLNLLSDLDDGDNNGLAMLTDLRGLLAEAAGRELTLELHGERRDAEFEFPGARAGQEYYRDWNLDEGAAVYALLDETQLETAILWGSEREAGLRLGASALALGDRYDGRRLDLSAGMRRGAYGLLGELRATGSSDSLRGDGHRERASLRLNLPAPLLRAITLEREQAGLSKNDSRDATRLPELRSDFSRETLRLDLGARDKDPGPHWTLGWSESRILSGKSAHDHLRKLDVALRSALPGAGRLSAGGRYQKREGFGEGEQFQAESSLGWLPSPGGWGGDARYRLGSRQQRLRLTSLIYIGPGQGDRNEEGIYVGEGEGDYRRVSLPSEESVRTVDLELEARLLREEGRDGSLWRRLGSETRLTLREENRRAEIWRIARLDPTLLRRPGATLNGMLELRQELRLRPAGGDLDLRYVFQDADRLDARDSAGSRRERERRHELRLRKSGRREKLELTIEQGWRKRRSESDFGGGSYDVRELSGELTFTRHLGRRISAALNGGWAGRRDRDRDLAVSEVHMEPELTVSPWRILRVDLSWRFTRSDYGEGDPALGRPWFFDAAGWEKTLRAEATAQAGGNLTLSLRYEMLDQVDRDLRHRLRMESRAYF